MRKNVLGVDQRLNTVFFFIPGVIYCPPKQKIPVQLPFLQRGTIYVTSIILLSEKMKFFFNWGSLFEVF